MEILYAEKFPTLSSSTYEGGKIFIKINLCIHSWFSYSQKAREILSGIGWFHLAWEFQLQFIRTIGL